MRSICWVIWNLNSTDSPNLLRGDCFILTKKHPSPLTNPTNQFRSGIDWSFIISLLTGFTLGKAAFNLSDKPRLIEALRANILWKPFSVKCSLVFIIKNTDLNNK